MSEVQLSSALEVNTVITGRAEEKLDTVERVLHLVVYDTVITLPANLVMMNGAQLLGCPVAIHTRLEPAIRAPRMEMISSLVSRGLIKPHISHEFPLAQVKEALLAKWNRKIVGGCVVDCN